MLNKRVKTFLTLMLAGAMVLSEPAASWAASEEASQTESTKSGTEDSEKEEKSADKKEDKSTKKNKKASGNSASSDDTVSKSASFSRVLSKASAAPEEEEPEDDSKNKADDEKKAKEEDKIYDDTGSVVPENKVNDSEDEEVIENGEETETDSTPEKETPAEPKARFSNESPFATKGGESGKDYSYDPQTGVLTVLTTTPLEISGTISDGSSLSVNSTQGANLTLKNLHITTSVNSALYIAGGGNVQIHLEGEGNPNVLTGQPNSIQVVSGNVTIDGSGVLSGNTVNGTVKVKGGNIQANIPNAKSVSGNHTLKPNRFNTQSANTLYSVSLNSVTGMEGCYTEGVYSDHNGNISLYLPEGYQITRTGTTLMVNAVPIPSASPSPNPSASPSPSGPPRVPDKANEADNGLYYIDSNTTYRSGATLQFYATGAGYGPKEPQESNPVEGSTRYIPTDWKVSTTSSSVSSNGSSAKGSWTEYSEEERGEYRYKGSFLINTTGTSSVPFTLQVNYNRQTYRADGTWRDDGTTASKSVNFYIRNTTATVTNRQSTTPYIRSTVTTSATRSGISTNARNAATGDETPIGTLVLLLAAAAISGTAIFRKKRMRQ